MYSAALEMPWDLGEWRRMARAAWQANLSPAVVDWQTGAQGGLLPGMPVKMQAALRAPPRVSRDFLSVADAVLCHSDPRRHALLYRLLWRMATDEPHLLERATDPDVYQARELEKSVRRDNHKMKAFVRFREVPGEHEAYVAWFEPSHYIVDRVAPFFARRFAGMRWAILTPYRSVQWDGDALCFGPGSTRADAPTDDAQDALWRTYYANIFNPARLNPRMMRQEMPQKYWKLLPETRLLPDLIREAGARVRDMAERMPEMPRRKIPAPRAPDPMPPADTLGELKAAALECRQCPLWEPATQTVFGEGPANARIMVIGEQPGDEEDLSGRPFVGPAGRLFTRALEELGLQRSSFYLTNAVKHFRFERRGKFRLHKRPDNSHVRACRGWLEKEIGMIRPDAIVCLGATAAQAVLGRGFKLMEDRGHWHTLANGIQAMATVHPSWILRQPAEAKGDAYAGFLRDLQQLQSRTTRSGPAASTSMDEDAGNAPASSD